VLQALREAAIPIIVLKGAAMAPTLYGDVGLRYMHDVDLLVPEDARARGMAVLNTLGYRIDPGVPHDLRARARQAGLLPRTAGIYARYHFHYGLRRQGQPLPLELHWHIAKPGTRVAIADFWQEARAVEIAGVETLCFRPEHFLLHLCLHLAGDPYRQLRLARLIDLWVAIDRQRLDWDYLRRAAQKYGIARAVRAALGLTREILGVPLPAEAGLGDHGPERRLVRLLSRWWLADLGARMPGQAPASRSLLWKLACRHGWPELGCALYRMVVHYPENNRFLPKRYAGSELMNLVYAFHPSRLRGLIQTKTERLR
jgi:hypothetical protein